MTDQETVKYPNISVTLVGEDSSAYFIMGKVIRALKGARVPKEEIDKFKAEATSGDYSHLLVTCMRWVNCE